MKNYLLFPILLFMGVLFSKVHAQEIPAVFANDSLYHRYGTMYSVDNLPKVSYHDAKQRGIPPDSLRWLMSFGETEDSVRVFARPEQIRVNKVKHVIIEKNGFEAKGLGSSLKNALECLEEGALLFKLEFDIEFRYTTPQLCRHLSVCIENFDPSFTRLEFQNVNTRISPYCPPDSVTRRRTAGAAYHNNPSQRTQNPPARKHHFYADFCIEGEIHGERILPDGSYRTGKLYDFRINYEQDDGYVRGNIKPYTMK